MTWGYVTPKRKHTTVHRYKVYFCIGETVREFQFPERPIKPGFFRFNPVRMAYQDEDMSPRRFASMINKICKDSDLTIQDGGVCYDIQDRSKNVVKCRVTVHLSEGAWIPARLKGPEIDINKKAPQEKSGKKVKSRKSKSSEFVPEVHYPSQQ